MVWTWTLSLGTAFRTTKIITRRRYLKESNIRLYRNILKKDISKLWMQITKGLNKTYHNKFHRSFDEIIKFVTKQYLVRDLVGV